MLGNKREIKRADIMEETVKESLKRAWRERALTQKQTEDERRCRARVKATAIAEHIKKHYGVKKVYLYGSLVWSGHFTVHSDIDLMVVGFQDIRLYWRMMAEVIDLASPFDVNLVLEEDAFPSLREKVLQEGEAL